MAVMDENKQETYRAGPGRRIAFSIVFVLLLPFFLSLGPMLFWRLTQGQWLGTIGLMILAAAFFAVMALLLVELMFSIRSDVTIGEKAARLTLPAGRGITPIFNYKTHVVPYDQVDSVEIRREIYRNRIAPVMMKGARVKMKDGGYVKLGYVNEANVDPFLPFDEIGEKIAARAGVPIVDRGHVYRSARAKYLGKAAADPSKTVSESEIRDINKRHDKFMFTLVGVLVVFLILGIASDRDRRIDAASIMTLFESAPPAP